MEAPSEERKALPARLDFPDKIEDMVSGILYLASSFGRTLWHLGFRQSRFVESYERDQQDYFRPLSMLFLLAFLATKAVRIVAVGLILALTSFVRSCERETLLDIEKPAFLVNPLTLPSIDEIVFVGIPLFLGVVVISRVIGWALLSSEVDGREKLKQFAFYAVAFHLACCAAVAALVALSFFNADHSALRVMEDVPIVEVTVVLIAFVWPTLVYYRLISRSPYFARLRPRALFGKRALLATMALVLTSSTTVIALAATYPYVLRDTKSFDTQTPVLGAYLMRQSEQGVTVLFANNSKDDLWLLGDGIRFVGADRPGVSVQPSGGAGELPVVLLKAGSATPLFLAVQERSEDGMASEKPMLFGPPGHALAVDTLTPSGTRKTVYSIIKDEKGEELREFLIRPRD